MWDKFQDLNEAAAALGEEPWFYVGDVDVREGGIATRVNRRFGYADVVEVTDLGSATGQTDAALIEVNSVPLGSDSAARRHYRSGMDTVGLSIRGLAADYPGPERWKRWAEIARALYIYGYRDTPRTLVVGHSPDSEDGGFAIDDTVDGREGLEEAVMGMVP